MTKDNRNSMAKESRHSMAKGQPIPDNRNQAIGYNTGLPLDFDEMDNDEPPPQYEPTATEQVIRESTRGRGG